MRGRSALKDIVAATEGLMTSDILTIDRYVPHISTVPAIAGRSPSYVARQLYDLQIGVRNGAWSDLMDAAVANLSVEDIVNIAAYTASLEP